MLTNPHLGFEAMIFAYDVHASQVRKYTFNPYTDHLAEVAGYVAVSVPKPLIGAATAVAWLHDSIEDQNVAYAELVRRFGYLVANGVWHLTDREVGNRATRKALACQRIAKAPGWVQTVKVADGISNYRQGRERHTMPLRKSFDLTWNENSFTPILPL
jgi:GTP diphosphokinase / guanosine-3',5'-bis(diphosphate) 3'-diphosphatase